MTTPNSFENTPIDAKDGTLRYFLSLPDGSDNETPIEELSNIAKEEPARGDHWEVVKEGEYKEMPLSILENLLGTSTVSDDEKEQAQVMKFIKKQSSFTGDHFKQKYPGFPERFYGILEEESRMHLKMEFDTALNSVSLEKV